MLATDDRHTVCLTDVQGPMIILPDTCTLLLPLETSGQRSLDGCRSWLLPHADVPQGRDGEGAGGSHRQSHSMIRAVVCSRFQCLSNGSRSEKRHRLYIPNIIAVYWTKNQQVKQ